MPITATSITPRVPLESSNTAASNKTTGGRHSRFTLWGDDGFTFGDLIDVVNPLQHIPVLSTIYRALSRDTIAAAPRLLGGALFGGVIGAAAAAANTLLEQVTGKDVGDHVLTLLQVPAAHPLDELDEPVAIAKATPPVPSPLSSAAVPQATVLPASSPPAFASHEDKARSSQEIGRIGLLARATRQLRLLAALDTYAQRSRLLAAHAGERVDAQF